jgi:hypothetical protein
MDGVANVTWRKASYSGNNGGDCVEVASAAPVVMVRDTKDRGGLVLSVPVGAWERFTATFR